MDNSLDACEEAGTLPEIEVRIDRAAGEDRFLISVRDNGPGIVKAQIPNIFAKLLYGSKFHTLKQSRGQQGLGGRLAKRSRQARLGHKRAPHAVASAAPTRASAVAAISSSPWAALTNHASYWEGGG